MSLFWGEPWPDADHSRDQKKRSQDGYLEELGSGALSDWRYPFGMESDWNGAMKIEFKGHALRVFPHEFVVQTPTKMRAWVFGIEEGHLDSDPTHVLVENDAASALMLRQALETDLRGIFDAALLDGCNPQMALAVTMEVNVEDDQIEFPNIGWYRPTPEVLAMYCYEDEATEDEPYTVEELTSVKGERRESRLGGPNFHEPEYE